MRMAARMSTACMLHAMHVSLPLWARHASGKLLSFLVCNLCVLLDRMHTHALYTCILCQPWSLQAAGVAQTVGESVSHAVEFIKERLPEVHMERTGAHLCATHAPPAGCVVALCSLSPNRLAVARLLSFRTSCCSLF
jgi:hypothetical protein